MSELEFINDGWMAMSGVDDPAISATFAPLKIRTNAGYVTYVEEKSNQSTANHILVPLYPVAEWIVANWWFLTEESQVPNRADFWERHSLAQGREGFAFPDLRIIPEGPISRLEWHPWQTRHMNVNFLAAGEIRIPTDALRQVLADFVAKVIDRLRARNVLDTWLEREWRVIQNADPEEVEFCQLAAWLGLDPYELNQGVEAQLIAAYTHLAKSVREEALRAASAELLDLATAWIAQGTNKLPAVTPNGAIGKLRQKCGAIPLLATLPWEDGYRLARELRKGIQAQDMVPFPLEILTESDEPIITAPATPIDSFDGICGVTKELELRCFTSRHRRETRRFTFARGILEWVFGNPEGPIMLTSATTQRQQRNRAFAAELLAPADLIRKRLTGSEIGAAQLQDLGDEFEVSSWVIQHQIKNHRLATLLD